MQCRATKGLDGSRSAETVAIVLRPERHAVFFVSCSEAGRSYSTRRTARNYVQQNAGKYCCAANSINYTLSTREKQDRRGIHEERIRRAMQAYDINKKWLMVNQDQQAESLLSKTDPKYLHQAPPLATASDKTRSNSKAGLVVKPSASKSSETQQQQRIHGGNGFISEIARNASATTTKMRLGAGGGSSQSSMDVATTVEKNTPEYFIRILMEPGLQSVTPTVAAHLEVSLRTRPVEYVS